MRRLEIVRLEKTDDGVLGVLIIDGLIFCYTFEHPTLLLRSGTYPACFEYSEKFGRKLYELKCTGDRDEIKIHIGNTMDDTVGCPLLGKYAGTYKGKRAVLCSGETIDKFHHEMDGATASISILDITGI